MKKNVSFISAVLPVVFLAHSAAADNENYGNMMNWSGNGGMMGGTGAWGVLMFLTWLIWLVVGVLLIIWLWKKISKK